MKEKLNLLLPRGAHTSGAAQVGNSEEVEVLIPLFLPCQVFFLPKFPHSKGTWTPQISSGQLSQKSHQSKEQE